MCFVGTGTFNRYGGGYSGWYITANHCSVLAVQWYITADHRLYCITADHCSLLFDRSAKPGTAHIVNVSAHMSMLDSYNMIYHIGSTAFNGGSPV